MRTTGKQPLCQCIIPNASMGLPRWSAAAFVIAVVMLNMVIAGCSTNRTNQFLKETNRPADAQAFFNQLDEAVDGAAVNHRAYARIENFPYLRSSRYLAALKVRLDTPARKSSWLMKLQALDLEAREKEIANLPPTAVERMTANPKTPPEDQRQVLLQKTRAMSQLLLEQDRQAGAFFPALIEAVKVPDDYSMAMRTFGLYPLVMPVVAYFTDNAYDKMRERNQVPPADQITRGKTIAYALGAGTGNMAADARQIHQAAERDPFGLPLLSESDKLKLAQGFAPVFVHDVADRFDIPGEVGWDAGKLVIDTGQPTVYYYFSESLFQGMPILQINYVTWTSGRLGPHAPSIERGELDGITLRVSLDHTGAPFLVDGMNNCGCYHFFIPDQERLKRVVPADWDFDAVVIDHLPADFPEKPIGIRVTSGWHQVEDVGTALPADGHETYRLLPYQYLESIPQDSGVPASMFDHEGVGIGSDRIEIYIFFSMGIPRVGAMRQRGHHPTKLVGRAHFDDPYLLDKNFEFK